MFRPGSGRADPAGLASLERLADRYRAGTRPAEVIRDVLERITARGEDRVWISVRPAAELLAEADELARRWPGPDGRPPLFGVPVAVKDNIDVAGLPTTAACPGYRYEPPIARH